MLSELLTVFPPETNCTFIRVYGFACFIFEFVRLCVMYFVNTSTFVLFTYHNQCIARDKIKTIICVIHVCVS